MEATTSKITHRAKLLKYLLEHDDLTHGQASDMFCLAPGQEIAKINAAWKEHTLEMFAPILNIGSRNGGSTAEYKGKDIRYAVWAISPGMKESVYKVAKQMKWM